MWTFYRDVTLYAIGITLFTSFIAGGAFNTVMDEALQGSFEKEGLGFAVLRTLLFFGFLGTGLGVLAFHYFQKQQYYMYYNLGYTRRFLILRTWMVNLGIMLLISPLVVFFV